MATITYSGATDGTDFDWELAGLASAPVVSSSAHTIVFNLVGDQPETLTFYGDFTAFDVDGRPTAGTLQRFTVTDGAETTDFSGLSIPIVQWNALVAALDVRALQNVLFGGPDTI